MTINVDEDPKNRNWLKPSTDKDCDKEKAAPAENPPAENTEEDGK